MERERTKILVVDDFEPWRHFIRLTLLIDPRLEIVGEISDGPLAVRKSVELHPDVILLDFSLPTLNGIEAARQIRQLSPKSKILFVSENRDHDIIWGALLAGASGYVLKSDAGSELIPAIQATLQGRMYVSSGLETHVPSRSRIERPSRDLSQKQFAVTPKSKGAGTARHHEAGFYWDDEALLEDLTQFAGRALKFGNTAVIIATGSHRDSLLFRLQQYGLDTDAAVEQGRYVALDAEGALAAIMDEGVIDSARFLALLSDLISTGIRAARAGQSRVAIFGECVQLLWTQGNPDAAIQMEKLGNQLANKYDIEILCGYRLGGNETAMDSELFRTLCAEHSVIHTF